MKKYWKLSREKGQVILMKERIQIARWKDLVDHWHRKGMIDDHYQAIARSKLLDEENPFDDELQRFIAFKALEKRFALDSSVIDEKYERMTKLFASEGMVKLFGSDRSQDEKVTGETFKLLEKLVTWEHYSIDGIRPMIYRIRETLDDDWTLIQVIEIILGIIKDAEENPFVFLLK
jgi:hypothetical protein